MLFYRQSTGELLHDDYRIGLGYSGHGAGKNNTAMQDKADVGPIPIGIYTLSGPTDTHGPLTYTLTPDKSNVMYERSGFLIHGYPRTHFGGLSKGCIILPLAIRNLILSLQDRQLHVTP